MKWVNPKVKINGVEFSCEITEESVEPAGNEIAVEDLQSMEFHWLKYGDEWYELTPEQARQFDRYAQWHFARPELN